MKIKAALLGLVCLTFAGAASAQGISQDSAWQFRSASDTAVLQNSSNMIQLQKSGYYDLMKNGALGLGGSGSGGLLGSGATATQNFFQVNNSTVNNCTGGSAVGATLSCGGGSNTVTGNGQNSTGNTTTTTSTVTGNTVTNKDNQSSVQTGAGSTVNNSQAPTGQ